MEEEIVSGETETPVESQPEEQSIESPSEDVKPIEEPVDETGVPLKNREAEARRKAAKALQSPEQAQTPTSEDEAIRIVKEIASKEAEEKIMKRIEPILVRQFLSENPDAANHVDRMNQIRLENPELKSVDKLDLVYKIAKAEAQDEIIAKKLEQGLIQNQQIKEKSQQASIEGTGAIKSPSTSLVDKINNANSLADLQALEDSIKR